MNLSKAALLTAFLANHYSANIQDRVGRAADFFAAIAVQQELNNISQMVYIDQITDDLPPPEKFQDYLRRNLLVRDPYQGRDTSLDFWGHPYKLEKHLGRYSVLSAGPDGVFGTDDDLSGGFGPSRVIASAQEPQLQKSRPAQIVKTNVSASIAPHRPAGTHPMVKSLRHSKVAFYAPARVKITGSTWRRKS